MSVSDPVADMLTKIRNAAAAGHEKVDVPSSKLKLEIVKILKTEGFIKNFKRLNDAGENTIRMFLKYDDNESPVIHGIERVSTPGRRVYSGYKMLPRVYNGYGTLILSTSVGVITGKHASEKQVGGELICKVWSEATVSRIGKLPVAIPAGVKVSVADGSLTVEGPKGKLSRSYNAMVQVKLENSEVLVTRVNETKEARSFHGLYRNLIHNMVVGVSQGFSKTLVINGVGYRAEVQGKLLVMALGYSNDFIALIPEGIEVKVEPQGNKVIISGIDKEKVGEFAAQIRKLRLPEPYKGKGIRYETEVIKRKVGKTGVK